MNDYPFTSGSIKNTAALFWHEAKNVENLIRIEAKDFKGQRHTVCYVYITPIHDLIYKKCFVVKDPFKSEPIRVFHFLNDLLDWIESIFKIYPSKTESSIFTEITFP